MARLPPLPSTSDLIRLYGLSAKQQLSQNFLLDLNVTDKIVKYALPLLKRAVLEVGPGPGSLTRSIINAGAEKVVVVEKDKRFIPALETIQAAIQPDRMKIYRDDILKIDQRMILEDAGVKKQDWSAESEVKVLGNLPFGVSTELLIRWMHQIPKREGPFAFGRTPLILMFQKEVAMRICAPPGTKQYGRLSVMVQQACDAKQLFDIPGSAFVPPPKVTGTAVYVVPRVTPRAEVDLTNLEDVLRFVFTQRRKTLGNAIKTVAPNAQEMLHQAKISKLLRPEDLSVEEWCRLANVFGEWKKSNPVRSLGQLPKKVKLENLAEESAKAKSFFKDDDLDLVRAGLKNKPTQ